MSPDASPSAAPRPRRLTAVVGAIAAAAMVAAFFLPLFTVDATEAGRLADRIESDVTRRSRDDAMAKDFASVFRTVTDQGHVTPADLVHYARVTREQRDNLVRDRAVDAPAPARETPFDRLLILLIVFCAAPPVGGLLLCGYFLFHGLRRAKSPMLVLALIVGVLGAAFPVAHQYARFEVQPYLGRSLGFWVQLGASATLLLVALFGVRWTNWWRVYAVGALMLACIGAAAFAYANGSLTG